MSEDDAPHVHEWDLVDGCVGDGDDNCLVVCWCGQEERACDY